LRADVEEFAKAKAKDHGLSQLTNQTASTCSAGDVLIVDLSARK